VVTKRLKSKDGLIGEYLEGLTQARIRSAAGFVKGRHRVPDVVDAQAAAVIAELAEAEIAAELQGLYETCKRAFGMRKRQITREVGEGFGSLANKFFRFSIHAEQHPTRPTDYLIVRRLELPEASGEDAETARRLDAMFGAAFDKVVVEVDAAAADFDRLVEMFEDLEEADGGRLRDEEDARRITYTASGGATIVVDLVAGRIELIAAGPASCSRLLALAQHYRITIAGTVNVLSSG